MRALVTGGGGFIGSRLVHSLLEKGHRVTVLDIQAGRLKDEKNPNLEFVGLAGDHLQGGMVDKELVKKATKGVDVVYHLAVNWDGYSWTGTVPLAELFNANVRGTLNLLEAAKSSRVRHFLFASSVAVYGKSRLPILSEDAVCRPELWKGGPGPGYAVVKLATEKLCLFYHHERDIPVTVFRIDVVFDDDEYQDLETETLMKARRGELIEVGSREGGATVHVDDVVQAFSLATLNQKAYGQIFNISNPAAYVSDLEVCRLVIKSIGSSSGVKLTRRDALTGPRIQSVDKARRRLGWRPRRTKRDLRTTIAKMARGP